MNACEARAKTTESIPPKAEEILKDIHTGIGYACERGDSNYIWSVSKHMPESVIKEVLPQPPTGFGRWRGGR